MKKPIFIILYATILICSCNDKLESIRKTFGTNQNITRQKYHLVPVTSSFQLKEDNSIEDRRFIFVNKEESKIKTPAYLRKTILLDSSKQYISIEEDYFKNPIEKLYLIIHHDCMTNLTNITLQTIAENPSNSQSLSMGNKQADSILKSWKVIPNPF